MRPLGYAETMEIKDRLIQIRKTLNMNQTEFAGKLRLTQSLVSRLESGNTPIIEQNIQLICLIFNINETWLRTGEGAMFNESRGPQESELLRIFDQLSADGQGMILEYAQLILKNERILRKADAPPEVFTEKI